MEIIDYVSYQSCPLSLAFPRARLMNLCAWKWFSITASLWNWAGQVVFGFSLEQAWQWESLQGTEPLMFADHPVDVLYLFYQLLFPTLFTRLFLMHLTKSENLKSCLDFLVLLGVGTVQDFQCVTSIIINGSDFNFQRCLTGKCSFKACWFTQQSWMHTEYLEIFKWLSGDSGPCPV